MALRGSSSLNIFPLSYYISSVSVLDNKCLISPEFQRFFRHLLLRKPFIHLRSVCLESSGCVLINIHFHHVNEATFQVLSMAKWDNSLYWWTLGWVFESRLEHYEQAEHDIRPLLCSSLTWKIRLSMALTGITFLHSYVIFIYRWHFTIRYAKNVGSYCGKNE